MPDHAQGGQQIPGINSPMTEAQEGALYQASCMGAHRAAVALSRLMKRPVRGVNPSVFVVSITDIPDFGDPESIIVAVYHRLNGDMAGHACVLLPAESARRAVEWLTGSAPAPSDGFDEMSRSAICEIGNIVTCSYVGALADCSGLYFVPEPPGFALDMARSILETVIATAASATERVLLFETDLAERSGAFHAYFLVIPDISTLEQTLRALGMP